MRICHIQTRLLNGGADENTVLTCNHQVRKGHDVFLIYGNESHPEILEQVDKRVLKKSIPSLQRSIHPLNDWRAVNAIGSELRAFAPDIVHTHTSKAGILGRIAARNCGSPAIVHGVHILPFLNVGPLQKLVYVFLEKLVSYKTDHYICVSRALLEENVRHRIAPAARHSVVPSGMDVDRFRNATPTEWKTLLPERFHDTPNPRFVVYVGALEKRKRQLEFLSVVENLRQEIPEVIALFVGGGQMHNELDAEIQRRGLERNAYVTGFRKDVEQIIMRGDVCVLASEREGLARVLIQYGLAGKAIVTTELPGVEVVVKDGINGYVVPVDDVDRMTAPILSLLKDSALRARFAEASRATDLSAWSAENMVEQIERIYTDIL